MAVELLEVVPAANPLGGLVPGVKVVGAANEPSRDKHDGGESETLQPRENNVDDRTIPVIERQQSTPLRQRPAIADRRDALVQVQYVPTPSVPIPRVPGSQHHQILAHFSTAMPNRVQRLRIHPPQSCQLVGIDAIALPLATLRPFHQPRVGHQHLVSPLGDHVLHPSRVSSYFDHYPRHCQCLEELPYIFLRCPQLSFGQRFSLQTKNAVLTPAVSQIHSHRQTISIWANCVSLAIFFCARRHRRRIQFSRQLPQDFREYFFRISLHRTSRFRPLQGWFTPLQRLAMLLQGRSPFSCDCTLSALITASLTPSVIGDRPSHAICYRQPSMSMECSRVFELYWRIGQERDWRS